MENLFNEFHKWLSRKYYETIDADEKITPIMYGEHLGYTLCMKKMLELIQNKDLKK